MKKYMVAMSGGVDSAVSAKLIKEKYGNATGITLKMFDKTDRRFYKNGCENPDADVIDAKNTADILGIEHLTYDYSELFEKYVIDAFIESYLSGDTPNPCVLCNKHIKFGALLDAAKALGFDKVATGHYAIIEQNNNGRYILKKAKDPKKDQTYFLYSLTQEQLKMTEFPLGEFTKEEARALADTLNLPIREKKDSQDICFIPDGDFYGFICSFKNISFPSGNYVDKEGNILGLHEGAIKYTVGQRKGLGIALGQPMYVLGKNMEQNTVTLGLDCDLFSSELTARDVNFIPFDTLSSPMRVMAKVRYRHEASPATLEMIDENQIRVTFDTPQRAITSGQSVVLYDGDVVIGGGIIN